MNKLFTFALALAVCAGTAALLTNNEPPSRQGQSADAQMATDGAFRDGLYVGRLAAEGGRAARPPIGRWSGQQNRALFLSGYERGYNDSLASSTAGTNRTE